MSIRRRTAPSSPRVGGQYVPRPIGQDPATLRQELVSAPERLAANLGHTATQLVAASLGGILVVVLTAVTAFFLLREGARQTAWLVKALPLPDREVRELARNFQEVTQAMLLGTGATAVYEAVTAFGAYWLAGVPRPLVWAALTGVASVVPAVGAMLLVTPISLWLVATGRPGAGIAVILWGLIVMGGVSNYLLRPRLLGSRVKMNDLLVFIALFGWVAAFGPIGIILGPIITALLVSLVKIYQRDYRPEPLSPAASAAPLARAR